MRDRTVELHAGDKAYEPLTSDLFEIKSGGMGPCFGVIIFDAIDRSTHAAHFYAPNKNDLRELQSWLQSSFASFSMSLNVRVYVGGCCCDDSKTSKRVAKAARKLIEREINSFAPPTANREFKWPADDIRITELTLDAQSGTCTAAFYRHDDVAL